MSLWKKYKLGELVDVQNGYAFKSHDLKTHGIPVIKIKNIQPPNISFDDADYYPHEINGRFNPFLIKKKDILISMTGSHVSQFSSAVGKVGRYGFDKPALLNQRVGKLFSKDKSRLNEDFLYYLIARPEVQFELATNAGGSANQANISPQNIKNLEFEIPDLKTQTRIASILSSLDDKIELNRRMNHTLEQMAQALFNHYFVDKIDPDNLPEGWRWGKVGDYLQTISKTHSFQKPEAIFLNTSDISKGKVLHSNYTLVNSLPGQAKKSIKRNDILFSEIRPANKRYAFINFDAEDYVVSTKLMVLRSKSNIDSLFFYFLLTQEQTLSYLQNIAESRSGTFPQITFDQVKEIEFVIPNEDFLNRFIKETLKPTYDLIFNNEIEIQSLSLIRDTLLPKLMSGEIDVHKVMDEEQLMENELADFKTA